MEFDRLLFLHCRQCTSTLPHRSVIVKAEASRCPASDPYKAPHHSKYDDHGGQDPKYIACNFAISIGRIKEVIYVDPFGFMAEIRQSNIES